MTKARLEKLYVMLWEFNTDDKPNWTADEYKMLNHITSKVFADIRQQYYKNQDYEEVKKNLLFKYLPKEKK